jgi:hypothetical protein
MFQNDELSEFHSGEGATEILRSPLSVALLAQTELRKFVAQVQNTNFGQSDCYFKPPSRYPRFPVTLLPRELFATSQQSTRACEARTYGVQLLCCKPLTMAGRFVTALLLSVVGLMLTCQRASAAPPLAPPPPPLEAAAAGPVAHLFYVRHGQSQGNAGHVWAVADGTLTDKGKQQAVDSAKKLLAKPEDRNHFCGWAHDADKAKSVLSHKVILSPLRRYVVFLSCVCLCVCVCVRACVRGADTKNRTNRTGGCLSSSSSSSTFS